MSLSEPPVSQSEDRLESPDEPGEDSDASMSFDDTFELLSSHRRRYTLHYLQQRDRAELGDLSRQIAAWENDIDREEVSAAERKRVYSALQQFHLPKMDDKDVVEFDSRAGVVELGPAAEDVDVYLEVVEGRDVPWSQYYLALAAVNAALLSAVAMDAVVLSAIPDLAWAIFTVTTFGVSALVHTHYARSEMRLENLREPPETGE